jgi:hypothetical protein
MEDVMARDQTSSTGEERMQINRVFEQSRLAEDLVASAYENLIPICRQHLCAAGHTQPSRKFSGRTGREIQQCAVGI